MHATKQANGPKTNKQQTHKGKTNKKHARMQEMRSKHTSIDLKLKHMKKHGQGQNKHKHA